jgi:two-component system nitrate/nitrite response regulator NarL
VEISVSVRILIVDDHEVVRQGVRGILARLRPEWVVIGEAGNGKEAIQAAASANPDVIILDITMPVMSGLEAASRIAKMGLPSRILIFTMHESPTLISDVQRAGAHGYVQKTRAASDLVVAIESLLGGGTFFGLPVRSEEKKDEYPNHGLSFADAFTTA